MPLSRRSLAQVANVWQLNGQGARTAPNMEIDSRQGNLLSLLDFRYASGKWRES